MKVNLYEDNAGGLLLGANKSWYVMTPCQESSTFVDDAAAFALDDTRDWTVEHYVMPAPTNNELVAEYDNGAVRVLTSLGTAAATYLYGTLARRLVAQAVQAPTTWQGDGLHDEQVIWAEGIFTVASNGDAVDYPDATRAALALCHEWARQDRQNVA